MKVFVLLYILIVSLSRLPPSSHDFVLVDDNSVVMLCSWSTTDTTSDTVTTSIAVQRRLCQTKIMLDNVTGIYVPSFDTRDTRDTSAALMCLSLSVLRWHDMYVCCLSL